MKALGYNTNIFNVFHYGTSLSNYYSMFESDSLDAIVIDLAWDYEMQNFSSARLGVGSYYLFEAEYKDESPVNVSSDNETDATNSCYWYGSRTEGNPNDETTYLPRVGESIYYPEASNCYVWRCTPNPDQNSSSEGWAYTDFRWRWHNIAGQNKRFGSEFTLGRTGNNTQDSLFVTYSIKFRNGTLPEDLPGDTVLLSFIPAGFRYNTATESFFDYPEPIVHTNGTQTGTKTVLTMDDYRNMCGGGLTSDGFLKIELRISYYELDNRHLLSEVNSSTYRMVNFNPRVFYSGYGTLELDCIEIEDMLHRKMKENYDYFQDGLVSRVNTLSQSSDILTGVYTYDEPHQPQFDTFFLMQRMLGERPQRTMTAIADYRYREFQMQGSEYYDHIDAFIKLAKPKAVMPDPYPIRPSFLSDNQLDWNDPSNQNVFFQTVIDRRVTDAYRDVKKYTISPSINGKFYPIVQAFGRWKDNKWLTFMLPPSETQKMLQFLPLCYGADGIFDYRLFGWLNHPDYDEYAAINVQYPNGTSYVPPDSTTYRALLEANSKVLSYGPKTASMNWINSVTITETSYEPADVNLSSVWVDSIQDVDTNQTGPYGCYVECGMYTDTDSTPYLMLVNRRANHFAPNATYSYPGNVPVNQYDTCFPAFDSQRIGIIPDTMAYTQFGTYVAMFDSLGAQLHRKDGENIRVDIGPGDGILLQMCSTLPTLVTNNAELKNIAYLSGDIIIDNGAQVTIHPGTDTNIFANTSILVKGGATLTLSGQVIAGNNVSIRAELGSTISFDDAVCKWGQNSRLVIDSSTLISVNSSHMSSPDATLWTGINAMNGSLVKLENTNIAGSMENRIIDSNLIMHRCKVNVPPNGTGIAFENSSYDYYARITSPTNNYGFFGDSAGNNCGLDVTYSKGNVFLDKIKFTGLQSGIRFTSASLDTLWACVFEDNEYGIKLLASLPYISNCTFDVCIKGISSEFDSCPIVLCNRPKGIYYSTFSNCVFGLETKNANHVLKNNKFTGNIYGVRSGFDSNLNLSYDSNNVFRNTEWNVSFFVYQDPGLYPKMQLYRGHNDFYHSYDGDQCYDFSFVGTWSGFGNQINASGNWFEGSEFTVDDPSFRSRIKVDYYDTQPNVPSIPEDPKRIDLAMTNEDQGLYDLAMTQYRAILDSMSDNEKDVWSCAADGVYRLSNLVSDQSSSYTDYFALKANQYEQDDQNTSVMLSNYQMKLHVAQSEFQEAIDIVQNRIDESSCEIDSLSAVMDLEVVLMLSDMNSQKRPVFTKFEQFKYPNLQIFHQKHEEHRVLLDELLNGTDDGLIPIPGKALISSNYPNPFNPSTTIAYSIPQDGLVRIGIYNIKGQKVKDLCNSEMLRGHHKVLWDGKDANQRNVSSGIYFVKLQSSGVSSTRKIMLMK
jgi:hypothetical protein